MSKVKVKLNGAGVRAILNSEKVQSELLSRAERIKARAETKGGKYVANVQPGKTRAHAIVGTDDFESRLANSRNNSLLKSFDAGR